MGRRKIEIQPITVCELCQGTEIYVHERNRAVTFLKRKNGLFKKAYELGVLCSVDVAVIIFEERPGHQVKLYQYCSSDVNNIVQRHLQFDGERDTKTPVDFSHSKGEDGGDDEDEIDEDEHAHASSSKQTAKKDKSKATAKSKESSGAPSPGTVPIRPAQANPSSESPMELDTRPGTSRTQGIPTPTGSNTTNIVPMLPISSDRLSSAQASRSSLGGGIHMPLPIPINMPSHKRPRTDDPVVPPPGLNFPYRLDVDLNTYPPTAHATSLSHSHSPSHQQHLAYPHNAMGINLGIQSPHAYPQSPAFDIHGRPPINYSQPQRNNSYPPSLEGLFGQRAGPGAQSQTANMLLDLLSSSAGMNMNGNPPPSFPAFDWPVTRSQSSQSEVTGSSQSDATSWLEFLASSPPSVQGTLTLGGLPTPTPTSRTPSSSISSLRPPSPPPSRKRNRDECEDDAGSRRSESTDGMQSLFDP